MYIVGKYYQGNPDQKPEQWGSIADVQFAVRHWCEEWLGLKYEQLEFAVPGWNNSGNILDFGCKKQITHKGSFDIRPQPTQFLTYGNRFTNQAFTLLEKDFVNNDGEAFTIFLDFFHNNLGGSSNAIIAGYNAGRDIYGESITFGYIAFYPNNSCRFKFENSSGSMNFAGLPSLTKRNQFTFIAKENRDFSLYQNGEINNTLNSPNTYYVLNQLGSYSSSYHAIDFTIFNAIGFKTDLNKQQTELLSDQPSKLFEPVSRPIYFDFTDLPEPSISSFDTSWKIKNIANKNSSFKIYGQNDKSLSWKLLNEKSSDLSWLIFDLSEKETTWKVLNLKEQETDCKIFNEQTNNISFKILNEVHAQSLYKIKAESEKDTAFKIQNEKTKQTQYKILNQAQKETAWKILSSGILSQDVSWKILKDIEKDTSYKILNKSEKDISWQILGLNQATAILAWKIINEVDQITEWKIKKEKESDFAWKILNELSLDTSFNILEIKSADLAYKIFNEIEKDISWKIISGVETKTIDLTATKRIFDFNSEQKICAFNSKTRTLIFYQKERK